MTGKTKNYTEEFKKQIVALKQNGKSTADIVYPLQLPCMTVFVPVLTN
ncbi:transposase [Clostridium grantii]|nr:transposase [Clostridium grantii]